MTSMTSPPKQPVRRPPTQLRAEETRAKILKAARESFAKRGFTGSNTRDIAAAAGVTHTLIRYHFGAKEQLWKDVVIEMSDRLVEETGLRQFEMIEQPSMDDFRELTRRYIRYCANNPEHIRILMIEALNGGHRYNWIAERVLEDHRLVESVLQKHADQGHLPKVWPVSLYYILTTMSQMPFVLASEVRHLYGVDMMSDAAIDAHTEAVLAILFGDAPSTMTQKPEPEGVRHSQSLN